MLSVKRKYLVHCLPDGESIISRLELLKSREAEYLALPVGWDDVLIVVQCGLHRVVLLVRAQHLCLDKLGLIVCPTGEEEKNVLIRYQPLGTGHSLAAH